MKETLYDRLPLALTRRSSLAGIVGLGGISLASDACSGSQTATRIEAGNATIRLADHLNDAQRRAIQAAAPVDGLADVIERVSNMAGPHGAAVLVPAGLYELRRTVNLHPQCWLIGEAGAAWPFPTYNPGARRKGGAVFFKNHNEDATISVRGNEPYAPGGGIIGISLAGDASNPRSNKGDGLVLDQVGSYHIREFRAFSIPRDAIVLGQSQDEVTGQIHLNEIYINNPGRFCLRNRSKWAKISQIETDGGACSYYADNAPNTDFTQFHFEGASKIAIILKNANGNTRFRGGYIAMTHVWARKIVELDSAVGNTDITFRDIQMVGHPDLEVGIDIDAQAWRTAILNCEIGPAPLGVRDAGRGTRIASKFLGTGLGIQASGPDSDYRGCYFVSSTGDWCIEHKLGEYGIWTEMHMDKPIKPTGTGTPGDFGTNLVRGNIGFKTAFREQAAGASPLKITHGMAATPTTVLVEGLGRESPRPADLTIEADATHITLRWSGGTRRRFSVDARAACETSRF